MSITKPARRPASRGFSARLAAVAGIVTFAVLAGTGTSWAYFTGAQATTAAASSGTLSVSASDFTSALAYQFRNDQYNDVASFTVTNASDTADGIARTATAALTSPSTDTARTIVQRKVWLSTAANPCTAAGVPASATASAWSTTSTVSASLAPAASATWCVQSYVAAASALATTGGSLTLNPHLAVSMGAQTWSAALADDATQNSLGIYPAVTTMPTSYSYVRPSAVSGTAYCLDVSGAADAQGTHVISWPCKTSGTSNQIWAFVADANNAGYFAIQSNNAQSRRVEQSTAATGSIIVTNTNTVGATTLNTQDWQVQQSSTGFYQFVNASTGLCLSATSASGDTTMQPCSDSANTQRFVVSPYISAATCSTSSTQTSGVYKTTLTLSLTTVNPQTLKVMVNGTQVGTGTASGGTATIAVAGLTGAAGQSVVVTDSSSAYSAAAGDTVLAIGTITPRASGQNAACTISTMVN